MDLKDIASRRPALLIIDVQNHSFRNPKEKNRLFPLISNINKLIRFFRENSLPIIRVVTVFKKDGSDWDLGMKRQIIDSPIEGTEGAKEVNELAIDDADIVLSKSRFSAFVRTDLEAILLKMGVDTVVLCGVWINWCVGWTAIDTYQRDFHVILSKEGTLGISHLPKNTQEVLYNIEGATDIKPSMNDEIIEWIKSLTLNLGV